MDVQVRSLAGASVGTITLDERVFGIEPNRAVLHQVVMAQLANRRQGTADTLTRGEVRGGGRKPWRQKGTGRARQGSIRAPHWRGGGIVFGPHPRSYHQALPRKMRRLALRSALSDKAATSNLFIVDHFNLSDMKTKTLLGSLQTLGISGKVILVLPSPDQTVRRASGNLQDVHVALPNGLSVVELLQADAVVFAQDAVEAVTQLLVGEADLAASPSANGSASAREEESAAASARTAAPAAPSASAPASASTASTEAASEPTAASKAPATDADAESEAEA